MVFSPLLNELIIALRFLPGIGTKSAQRIAFHLLQRDRQKSQQLLEALTKALDQIARCQRCRNFSETPLCNICNNSKRDQALLCIVESPADVLAIEQMASYRGHYFVLMGHLSPLDGIGPQELGFDLLESRFNNTPAITEVIIATNPTVEGEATAHYISTLLKKRQIKATRIAHGVPLGSELEYIDGSTLLRAFEGRGEMV
ncbi:MAG: recombination protein RecR [Gammaproteobacteria bacterium]|nr:recombination protein RecR [Gammaproteobacteria bacterium]